MLSGSVHQDEFEFGPGAATGLGMNPMAHEGGQEFRGFAQPGMRQHAPVDMFYHGHPDMSTIAHRRMMRQADSSTIQSGYPTMMQRGMSGVVPSVSMPSAAMQPAMMQPGMMQPGMMPSRMMQRDAMQPTAVAPVAKHTQLGVPAAAAAAAAANATERRAGAALARSPLDISVPAPRVTSKRAVLPPGAPIFHCSVNVCYRGYDSLLLAESIRVAVPANSLVGDVWTAAMDVAQDNLWRYNKKLSGHVAVIDRARDMSIAVRMSDPISILALSPVETFVFVLEPSVFKRAAEAALHGVFRARYDGQAHQSDVAGRPAPTFAHAARAHRARPVTPHRSRRSGRIRRTRSFYR